MYSYYKDYNYSKYSDNSKKLNGYKIQDIFQSYEFNKLDVNDLKEKYGNNNELFESLVKLKELQNGLIQNCLLTKNMLDNQGNKIMAWPKGEKRGGFDYYPPLELVGFGLKFLDKYDSNDWLTLFDENGWAVAYYGVVRHSNEVGKIVKLIITGGFKPGWDNFIGMTMIK